MLLLPSIMQGSFQLSFVDVIADWAIAPDPNGNYPDEDSELNIGSINKYSLFTAAAINMGILKISDLVLLSASSYGDDDGDDAWDDAATFDDPSFASYGKSGSNGAWWQ